MILTLSLSLTKKKKDFIASVEPATLVQMKTQPESLCEN